MTNVLITEAAKKENVSKFDLVFYMPKAISGNYHLKTVATKMPISNKWDWHTYEQAKKLISKKNHLLFRKNERKATFSKFSSFDGALNSLFSIEMPIIRVAIERPSKDRPSKEYFIRKDSDSVNEEGKETFIVFLPWGGIDCTVFKWGFKEKKVAAGYILKGWENPYSLTEKEYNESAPKK
jgi:hypothetical protein